MPISNNIQKAKLKTEYLPNLTIVFAKMHWYNITVPRKGSIIW
jgi:hypothetical protein